MSLLSGTSSTVESTLEPVTGVRNLTVESKSRYNDSLKVYESEVEDGTTKASVVIDIPGEADSNTDTNIQKVNGIHNINDEYINHYTSSKIIDSYNKMIDNKIIQFSNSKEVVYDVPEKEAA